MTGIKFKQWLIAGLIAVIIINIITIIKLIFNIELYDLAFLKGWIGCSGYYITLNYFSDKNNKKLL